MLATVPNRATRLTVVNAEDGELIRDGCVYVVPRNYHLIIDGRHPCLTHARASTVFVQRWHARDGGYQPAGGVTMQHPDEAQVPSMPLNAMRRLLVGPREQGEPRAGSARKRQAHG